MRRDGEVTELVRTRGHRLRRVRLVIVTVTAAAAAARTGVPALLLSRARYARLRRRW